MTLAARFRTRIAAGAGDAELRRNSPHLDVTVRLELSETPITLRIADGTVALVDDGEAAITVSASDTSWAALMRAPQPPLHNSFTALQIANPAFEVTGDPLIIATARAALDRLVECLSPAEPAAASAWTEDVSQIVGRYCDIVTHGGICRYYHEVAGTGPTPLVFLHTAGADSRQYQSQMADTDLAERFTMYAPDMPFHGRSMPSDTWDGGPYTLTSAVYRAWVSDFIETVIKAPALLVGGSMGAAIALVMAAERPDLTRGVVALEPPFQSKGRRNPYQDHVGVHSGLHNSAFTRGLMSPKSPLSRRRAASWIYSQGAPGVYRGDLSFYSDEFDGAQVGPRIDTARTPVALLSGTYDFSATPKDGAKLAATIPGALHVVMEGLGHFPATEHPALFRPHLLRGLEHVTG